MKSTGIQKKKSCEGIKECITKVMHGMLALLECEGRSILVLCKFQSSIHEAWGSMSSLRGKGTRIPAGTGWKFCRVKSWVRKEEGHVLRRDEERNECFWNTCNPCDPGLGVCTYLLFGSLPTTLGAKCRYPHSTKGNLRLRRLCSLPSSIRQSEGGRSPLSFHGTIFFSPTEMAWYMFTPDSLHNGPLLPCGSVSVMLTIAFIVHLGGGDAEGRRWDVQYSLTKHFLYCLPGSRGLPALATPTDFEIKTGKWKKPKPKFIRLCRLEFWILCMKCLFKKYKIQAESLLPTVWEKLPNTQVETSLCETSTHHFLKIYIFSLLSTRNLIIIQVEK